MDVMLTFIISHYLRNIHCDYHCHQHQQTLQSQDNVQLVNCVTLCVQLSITSQVYHSLPLSQECLKCQYSETSVK